MKLHRNGKWFGVILASAGISLMLVFLPSLGASMGAAATRPATTITPGGTFYSSQAWGTLADNFNPYVASASAAPGTHSCLYQSLFYINGYSGGYTPMLATSYKWKNPLELDVTTRSGVQWSDGTPFTAADVAFTFNYLKANPTLDLNGIWKSSLKSVRAASANTVVFRFSTPDTPEQVAILYGTDGAQTDILPQHIWASVTSPATYTNATPVVTGPFTVSSF